MSSQDGSLDPGIEDASIELLKLATAVDTERTARGTPDPDRYTRRATRYLAAHGAVEADLRPTIRAAYELWIRSEADETLRRLALDAVTAVFGLLSPRRAQDRTLSEVVLAALGKTIARPASWRAFGLIGLGSLFALWSLPESARMDFVNRLAELFVIDAGTLTTLLGFAAFVLGAGTSLVVAALGAHASRRELMEWEERARREQNAEKDIER